jgi:hypothetical protein
MDGTDILGMLYLSINADHLGMSIAQHVHLLRGSMGEVFGYLSSPYKELKRCHRLVTYANFTFLLSPI